MRASAITLTSAGALVLSGVIAPLAFADPSSCSSDRPTIGYATSGELEGDGFATCTQSASRNMNGEIKWDKNFAPDPLVAKKTVTAFTNYPITLRSCDNRNTRSYYMRTYFTSTSSDHHDSAHVHLTPNC
jgi:hypothetical protein